MAPKIYLGKTNEITEIIKIKSLWENSQGLFEKYESVLAFVCKNLEFRLNQTVSLTLSLMFLRLRIHRSYVLTVPSARRLLLDP